MDIEKVKNVVSEVIISLEKSNFSDDELRYFYKVLNVSHLASDEEGQEILEGMGFKWI